MNKFNTAWRYIKADETNKSARALARAARPGNRDINLGVKVE